MLAAPFARQGGSSAARGVFAVEYVNAAKTGALSALLRDHVWCRPVTITIKGKVLFPPVARPATTRVRMMTFNMTTYPTTYPPD